MIQGHGFFLARTGGGGAMALRGLFLAASVALHGLAFASLLPRVNDQDAPIDGLELSFAPPEGEALVEEKDSVDSAAQAEAAQHTSRGRRRRHVGGAGRRIDRVVNPVGSRPRRKILRVSQRASVPRAGTRTHPAARAWSRTAACRQAPGRPAGPDGERRPRREHGPRPFTGWRRLLFAPRIADTVPPGGRRLGSPRAVKRDLQSQRAERGSPALGTGRPRTSQRKQAFAWPCA